LAVAKISASASQVTPLAELIEMVQQLQNLSEIFESTNLAFETQY